MSEEVSNQEYENMVRLIALKDKQMATSAIELIERYETTVADVLSDIQEFVANLPEVTPTSRSSVRNSIEASLSQISAVISQVGYTKTSLNTHIASITT